MNFELVKCDVNILGTIINVHLTREDESTIQGTMSVLRNNKFHFDTIDFKPGDIFVDLGCNVGLVSMYIAKKFPFVKVLAFDASPVVTKCLELSMKANGINNISVYNYAVDTRHGEMLFHSDVTNANCLVSCEMSEDSNSKNYRIFRTPVIPFTDIFDDIKFGVDKIKYFKMDIEGGEWNILGEMIGGRKRAELLKKIEYFHLEIHHFRGYDVGRLTKDVIREFGDKVIFDV